jgi:quercetin dioxygenase-like cupin family protein
LLQELAVVNRAGNTLQKGRCAIESLYMLEGEVGYRHGAMVYRLMPGDSSFFDADVPHGPEELRRLPIRFLSMISHPRDQG